MGLIEKFEAFFNAFVTKLFELLWKYVPQSVKNILVRIQTYFVRLVSFVKNLPVYIKANIQKVIVWAKSVVSAIDFRAVFVENYKKAMEQYKDKSTGRLSSLKKWILTPFLIVGQWLNGLSPSQSLLLLSFSFASILSVIGIGFSGKRIMSTQFDIGRTPASVEEEVLYERPDYYKKQTRHFDVTNFRLPVYVAKVNEIRSVDVDFTATLSNRNARMFLEKNEFQLRDYLINNFEPSIASFPLEEEGKEIIRQKLWFEVNEFLKLHSITGEVEELKITYVLAN